ncbi:MAG: hypothetical protein WC755_00310 [Candidatus Woesearchaeota archaeon]
MLGLSVLPAKSNALDVSYICNSTSSNNGEFKVQQNIGPITLDEKFTPNLLNTSENNWINSYYVKQVNATQVAKSAIPILANHTLSATCNIKNIYFSLTIPNTRLLLKNLDIMNGCTSLEQKKSILGIFDKLGLTVTGTNKHCLFLDNFSSYYTTEKDTLTRLNGDNTISKIVYKYDVPNQSKLTSKEMLRDLRISTGQIFDYDFSIIFSKDKKKIAQIYKSKLLSEDYFLDKGEWIFSYGLDVNDAKNITKNNSDFAHIYFKRFSLEKGITNNLSVKLSKPDYSSFLSELTYHKKINNNTLLFLKIYDDTNINNFEPISLGWELGLKRDFNLRKL